MLSSMPLDLAEELTRTIAVYGEQATDALIQIVRAINDPDGDKHRSEVAWVVIKTAMPFSTQYGEMCALEDKEETKMSASAR